MGGFFDDLKKAATYQAILAELVGTGLLTLAALLAGTPYAVALILAALVYGLGPISGAQLNPAVTLGLLVARRQPVVKGVLYLVAQVAGALLAAKVAPAIGDLGSYSAGKPVGEFVGAGLLVLTVVAVSDKWVPKAGGGVAIGAALGAGLLLSNGVLNPAVALAMGLGRSPALWAAALGGVAFAALFDLLSAKQGQEQQEGEKQEEDAPKRQPEQAPASRPVVPAVRPIKPVVYAAPSARVTVPLPRPDASASAGSERANATPSRSLWSSLVGVLTRRAKPHAQRETVTRPGSGD
jgi:aquaporin Z